MSTNAASLEALPNRALWVVQVLGAILLLIPALSGIGALLAVPIMIGVIVRQLLIIGGSAALPIGLLIIASIVAGADSSIDLP